jgi:very-short-patch-repair endonuclease
MDGRGPDRDRRAASIGARQRHLITFDQLVSCGFTAAAVDSRYRRGRLHRLFTGVYSLAPPPFDRGQTWLAAVLACGDGALLCGIPAAVLLRMASDGPTIPHVCVPGDRRSRDGIVVHRRAVAPADRLAREGIPCTSAARTLIDVAAVVPVSDLERMLVTADSLRILNRRRLVELIEERRGARGIRALRSLVASDPAVVRSDVEYLALRLCRRSQLPEPTVNQRIVADGRAFIVDFCWPELRVIVEIDGYAFHGGRERANADRDRDQTLSLAGWTVHRFTADQVKGDPEKWVSRVGALLRIDRVGPHPSI